MGGVVLVAAGGSNLGSVRYALARLGVAAEVSRDAERIRRASHLVLPGVGIASEGMRRLRDGGLATVIKTLRQPVLGICVGMQLLFERSEEGDVDGLGLIAGAVRRIPAAPRIRVPHMGWNRLRLTRPHPLFAGIDDGARAYFVHSYAASVGAATIAAVDHGAAWSAAVARDNFLGVQFHPERSAAVGAQILKNFLAL